MDYAVGSVAALISGNVTPNRPRLIRRALTPTKHQASPNVTPKSEVVDDRSIFLSPSLQKKKAIVKKSPKRIFENPDLDITDDGEGSSALISPKADKVKKHLKEELEADARTSMSPKSPKSPKKSKLDKSIESKTPKKLINEYEDANATVQNVNESTPKKKKNKKSSVSMPIQEEKENLTEQSMETEVKAENNKSPKKKRKSQNITEENDTSETIVSKEENEGTPKKKKKNINSESQESKEEITKPEDSQQQKKKKKKRNKKGKNKANTQNNAATDNEKQETKSNDLPSPKKKNKNPKNKVNPNAITNKDSDSEHESDDEIQSENEQTNNEILKTDAAESSDDEEENKEDVKKQKQEKKEKGQEKSSEDEVKRTLFVGNVPFSKKCKKEIKKIFSKYGVIETVRIRTIPVKDARVTPKLAVIKNELHPERTTVNVYVKFQNASSIDAALAENNTVLNDNHLRVSRSDTTGSENDPHKAIFVGNLPFAIEDDTLRSTFAKCGEIESVRVVRDNKTKAGKGFGYVNFASKDSVELALAMTEEDRTIKNKILRIKRCTDPNKKAWRKGNTGREPGSFQGNPRSRGAGRSQGMKRRGQDGGGRNQGNFERNQGNFGRNQEMGRSPGGFGRNQGNFGRNQGNFGGNQGNFGRNQGFGRPSTNGDRNYGQDGANRRILKRQNETGGGGGDAPPSKRPNINQPAKEKKLRKEFVGITAEKKKKQKFNKGDKKKKALSEILTKHNISEK